MNRHGELDMSIAALTGMTGWPRDLLEQGIRQLMDPDPHSRTPGHAGARLVPLVEGRSWGWRAVNFGIYRERARKASSDAERVRDGRNAERMANRRAPCANPRRPAPTRRNPPLDSDSDSDLRLNPSG